MQRQTCLKVKTWQPYKFWEFLLSICDHIFCFFTHNACTFVSLEALIWCPCRQVAVPGSHSEGRGTELCLTLCLLSLHQLYTVCFQHHLWLVSQCLPSCLYRYFLSGCNIGTHIGFNFLMKRRKTFEIFSTMPSCNRPFLAQKIRGHKGSWVGIRGHIFIIY